MASVPVSATSLSGLGASNILSNAPEGSVLSGVVTDAKQQEVKARSLQKRLSLEFKRIQIGQSDILDADSIRMPDTGEILRLGSNKSGTAFDAFEVAHPNAPPVTDAEQAKRNIKKEARQRIAAANVLGKSPYEVTTEDINKLGEQGRQEAVKAITAGQEPTYRTDFDEAEDAQFAVDVRAVGEGIYGRPLVELRNSATGADINSDLNTRAINASYDTVYNQKKRHEDIARIYAEQEIADEKSKTRRIESVYLGGKDIGLPVSIGGGEYRALSNKEADTFGGAVTDTTGRLLAAGTGIIAMAVDLPLAGVEFLFDNLSATKAFKKDAEGNVIEVEDEKYLSAMRDIAMYQEQVRDQRTAVATAFSKGQEFFQLLTNNRNQEETIKALTKVYENETFGRDFIGVLSNNPKSVLEFVVDSLPFMYAAAKKGVAMPFAAAFTGENYKVGTELYAKEFGHEPEAKAKALILTGSAFIAALNSAGAKYVTGEWAGRAFLNKIGIEGVGNFLKATSIRLGSKVPESQLKTLSALLLEGTTIAAKQSLILATKASVEFLQEGSEGLITAASVRQSLNFTNDELRDASISGAIGFASGGTAPILFAGTHSSVKLAQSGANGTRSLIKSRDLNKRVSEFRNDTDFVGATAPIKDHVVVPHGEQNYNALETVRSGTSNLTQDADLFTEEEQATMRADLMRDVANLSAEVAAMTPEDIKNNPDIIDTLNGGLDFIGDQANDDQKRKHVEIVTDLQSTDEATVQRGVNRVLGSNEDALSVNDQVIDLAITKTTKTEQIARLNEIKEINKTANEVAKEVMYGGGNSGFIGVKTRQYLAEKLLEEGDFEGAEQQLGEIRRFYRAHLAKSILLQDAWKEFKETGKERTITTESGRKFYVNGDSKNFIEVVTSEVGQIAFTGKALAAKLDAEGAVEDATEVEERKAAANEPVNKQPQLAAQAKQGDLNAFATLRAVHLDLLQKNLDEEAEQTENLITDVETFLAKKKQEDAETAAAAEVLKTHTAEQVADNIEIVEEQEADDVETAAQEAIVETEVDKIIETEMAPENTINLEAGESIIVDVTAEAQSKIHTPIQISAGDTVKKTFNIAHVTLSSLFSRANRTKENNAVEPLVASDRPHLDTLDRQFDAYREIAKSLPKLVGKALKKFHADDLMVDMAALLLVRDPKTNQITMPDDVILASFMGSYNWMTHQARATLYNDDQLINQLLNQSPNSDIDPTVRRLFREKGSNRTFVAKTIGTDIFNSLGLQANAAHPLSRETMVISLGLFAIEVLKAQGLVEEHETTIGNIDKLSTSTEKVRNPKAAEFFIRVKANPDNNQEVAEPVTKVINEFGAALPTAKKIMNLKTYLRRPTAEPVKGVSDTARGNFFKLVKIITDKVQRLQNVPWRMNATAKLTQQFDEDTLRKMSGYVFDVNSTKHVAQRKAILAINRQIDDAIRFTKEQMEEFGETDFFLAYEVWGNSRVGITSNTFNPQASKYHRHIASPKSHKSRVSNKRVRNNFRLGITLAFEDFVKQTHPGFSDKGQAENYSGDLTETQFNEIIQHDVVRAAVIVIRKLKKSGEQATQKQQDSILAAVKLAGSKFHGLEALEALEVALDSNFDLKKDFFTTLSVETDGVTSGVTLGLMQSPIIKNVEDWLARGGIFMGNYKNLGEAREDLPTDAYQQLAVDMFADVSLLTKDAQANYATIEQLIGNLVNDKIPTSLGRKLMKSPLMVFSYGAGIGSIKLRLSSEIAEMIYDKIADNKDNPEELRLIFTQLGSLLQGDKKAGRFDVKGNMNKFLEAPLEWVIPTKYQNAFNFAVGGSVGAATAAALDTNFGELLQQKKVLLEGLSIAFHTFKRFYDRNVEIYKTENEITRQVLSKAERKAVLGMTKQQIPYFNSPYSTPDQQAVVSILTEEVIKMSDAPETKAGVYFSKDAADIPNYELNETLTKRRVKQGNLSATGRIKVKQPAMDSVAALVKIIHTLDSTLILDTLTRQNEDGSLRHPGLNIHDAQQASVDRVDEATRYYNQKVFQTSRDYNMVQDIIQMVTNTVSGLNDAQKAAVLDDVIKTEEHRLQYDKDGLEAINQDRYDMNHRIKWMNQVARDVTAAKQNLFQHITAIAQAALPSQTSVYNKSGRPTSTPFVPIKVDFDYHPGNYKDVPTEGVVTEERHLASSEENMIDFEASYTESATATTSQSIFNVLSHMGTINENSHHQRYLREILANIIEKALKPGEEFIVQVGKNAAQNVGDITGNKIRINLAPNRPPITLQQSAEEIYIHELIHGLTTSEIESNSVLRKRLDELFTIARDNLTPSDFLEEDIIENQTLDDQHQAALAAQARYDYIFNNKIVDRTQTGKNRIKGSNGLYEFIAFGLSNETLVKKLQRIPYHQKKADTSTLYEQLVDIFNRVLQFVTEKFRGTFDVEDNVYAQLYRLTEDIVGINEGWRFPVMGFLSGAQIYKQNAEVFITEKLENTRISINRLIADDRSKIGRAVFLLNNTLKAAKHAEVGPFITRFLEKHVENDGFIAGMGRALTGGSDRFKSWLPLLRYSKERIDTARKTAKEGIIKSLKNAFKTEPTDIEKAMLHDIVLKTDILSLLPDNPSNDQILEVLKLVENEQMIDTRIKAILNGLSVDQPTKKYYHNQSNNLGWFMATGKTVLDHANLNAFNIARKALTSETDNKLASSKTVAAIDELASLYALKYTSHNVKNDFVRFVKQELAGNPMENGVKALLTLASSHKKYSATVLFRDEDYNIIKGFANEILDPNLDIQIVPIRSQEAKDFKAMGYTLAFEMDSIGIEGERLGFYTAYTGAATTFQRTTFSTTSEQSKGTTLTQVYVKDTNGIVGRKMVRNAQNKIYREAMQQMSKQFTSEIGDLRKNRSKEKSPLIPLVNSQGEAYEYRVILSHAQKEKHLNQDKRVDEVLGSMYASMSDKLETRKINYRVITDLYDDYSRNFEDEPEAFVRIGQNGRYGDLWAVMPEQSKQLVKELTGKRELYVRAELVDLVMGYRKLSIKDSERFQKLPPLVKGVLGVTEKIWQEIVAYGAVQIVIKTPKVLIDNVISNTIMLLRDNVSPKMILDKHLEGIAGLNDYYSTVQEIHDLNIKLQQNPKNGANQSQIAKAHERLRLNPVRPLIEAGIFQSITEEINVSKFTDNSAFNNTRIGKAAVKLTPTFMIPVLKQAFMTKDTWLFNTMMKATQYSDFLARYTKYSFLTETSEFQALEGPAREAALQEIFADIVEDYVNYDVPQNKKMQYVNDMGGMRFTKYFLRTQRVITKKWQQQPVNMAISWGLQSTFGDVPDITDSFIFTSDIMGKVNGPVGLVGDAIIPKGAELVGLI